MLLFPTMCKTLSLAAVALLLVAKTAPTAELQAGVAKVEITDRAGPVNDPLYAKALVLKNEARRSC